MEEEQKEKPEASQGDRLPVRGDMEERAEEGSVLFPNATAASDAA